MSKLIIDIETIGEDFDKMDETSKEVLTHWAKTTSKTEEEYEGLLKEIKEGLGLSPLTGEIVAIGVLDYDKDQGVIYYQAPDSKEEDTRDGKFKYRPMSEADMLLNFWQGVQGYDEIITFNGRGFDLPYILARSAKHQINATKELMGNRYIESQKYGIKHIDLFDQLSYYSAVRRSGGLHMWCRMLGIKSPKAEGVKGDDVKGLFDNKEFLTIAKYNSRDLIATKELYDYWDKFMKAKPY